MSDMRPYSSLTPLPRIAAHVPSSQRQDVTAEIRQPDPEAVTRWVVPLGASGPQDVQWADLSKLRETAVLPKEPLSWPMRAAVVGLTAAIFSLRLLERATRGDR